jgi:hypothetical protein
MFKNPAQNDGWGMTANEIKGSWGLHHLKIYTIGFDVSNSNVKYNDDLLRVV